MSQLYRIILGCIFSLLFIVIPAKAQKEAEVYNVDSSLYAYYQRCQENLLEPVVLSMSDTLFHMAAEQNDQRMQAVALSTRLDYYYYQGNNEDSVVFHTSKVKQFATRPDFCTATTSCRRFTRSRTLMSWPPNGAKKKSN
mgnify:CR=1 FL=1